jgi:hypothetical protein
MNDFTYVGQELEIFKDAVNWKSYWLSMLKVYCKGNVADVGAGIGSTVIEGSKTLNFDRWQAIEPDPVLFRQLSKNIKILLKENIQSFLGPLSADKGLYDTILYIDVLEHILDDKGELELAASRLNPGGKLLILAPAHNFLFSQFDSHVGHYRRYNKNMLKLITPNSLQLERIFYLDSCGLVLSALNRFVLRSSLPKKSQIKFWDSLVIPISNIIDRLLGYRVGKSIVAVWHK